MPKHKIYVLVDPRNDNPFYVGATIMDLRKRLLAHITFKPYTQSKRNLSERRMALIRQIRKNGKLPLIVLLEECETEFVDLKEKYHYERLKNDGFELLQSPNFFTSSSLF